MTKLTAAIGDVHGCYDELIILLNNIYQYAEKENYSEIDIVFTGDYVDRGPKSKEVLDLLIGGPNKEGVKFICLLGNHDDYFYKGVHLKDNLSLNNWLVWGGIQTLQSFSETGNLYDEIEDYKIDKKYFDFIYSLPLYYDDGKHLFVHAGIHPHVKHNRSEWNRHELTWIRDEFLYHDWSDYDRIIVHGHTYENLVPTIKPNRINIDTGCCFGKRLTAILLNDMKYLQVQNIEQQKKIEYLSSRNKGITFNDDF